MRVTQSMMASRSIQNINQNYQRLYDLQQQASTGKKLTKPSDDPAAAMAAMKYRTELSELDQFQKNGSQADRWMRDTEAVLEDTAGALHRIRDLAVQASNGSYKPEDLADIGAEISQIKAHIVTLANSKTGDGYLFNGTDVRNTPVKEELLDLSFTSGPFPIWHEGGADEDQSFILHYRGESYKLTGNPGENPLDFEAENGSRISVSGLPGNPFFERIWTEDTPDGPEEMSEPASGAGIILSASEAVAGNGPQVEFEVMKGVNMQAGIDPKAVFSLDLFAELTMLERALKDPVTSSVELEDFISPVSARLDQIVSVRSELGARQVRADLISERVKDQEILFKRLQSENEDADMTKVITELMAQENIHRAALASSARSIQPSLLDFLR
ncbi:flagellar hook-associated protein 3 [Alteribacter lacisalsi]|uniref:Flagellar hook-associated protein 3 n=1 Tax=Alteribacter lacisalsi TaxID=2045244 RepID=A0A2W0H4B0_9BACI|nr:flagellar hook-associated protein FlgL [Alteribacter lacisalsi]PYZ95851.1 flagellar hook-associated protein 3 [Alteribacter lacisalsi]